MPMTSWPRAEQLLDDVAADEAGRAADEDRLHLVLLTSEFVALVSPGDRFRVPAHLPDVQPRPEGEAVPAQVLGQPCPRLKFETPTPVQPDRGDLGDRQPQPTRLGGQLQPDLEAARLSMPTSRRTRL